MATFIFDGSQSQTINFDIENDQLVTELNASEVVSVVENTNGVTITTTSGTTLLLAGVTAAALAEANFLPESFLQFGTVDDEPATGNDAFLTTSTVTGGVIYANDGDDVLTGADAADLFYGNMGDDTLIGGGGNDRLFGGMGDDTITAQNSADDADEGELRIRGGNDSDTIVVAGAVSSTFVGSGTFEGAATIYGGNGLNDSADGADSISALLGDDGTAVIYGNGGDDSIVVTGTGDATVFGGAGDDTIDGSLTAVSAGAIGDGIVYGGLGEDVINLTVATGDVTTIYGGNGANDTLDGGDVVSVAGAGDALIYGNAGDDIVVLTSTGSATVYGGQGDDTIGGNNTGTTSANVGDDGLVVGGLGEDVINLAVSTGDEAVIYGGNGTNDSADGDDTITVDVDGEASIFGNGGADTIVLSGAGVATVNGGAGADVITVNETGAHVLTGGVGDDDFRFDTSSFQAGAGTTSAELVTITDLNFSGDTIAFEGLTITSAADLSDYTPSATQATAFAGIEDAADVGTAAEAAFDFAVANSLVTALSEAGVVFEYNGDTFLAVGTDIAAAGAEVEAIVKITGATGSFGTSDFGTF